MENSLDCKIEEKPVVFGSSSFSTFQDVYTDFQSSTNEFDIFHYYSIGNLEKVERIFLTNQKYWILVSSTGKGKSQQDTLLNPEATELSELVDSIGTGQYWQKCRPYTSSPYYHAYIFKKNRKEILAYFIQSGEYNDIQFEEFENLNKAIEALKYLKTQFSNMDY